MVVTVRKPTASLYVCSFFVYCVIGWIYEVIREFQLGNGFVNRGFLYGPWLPVYGFGALLVLFLFQGVARRRLRLGRLPVAPVVVFLGVFVVASLVEYATGAAMEAVFHRRWWDYSKDFLNINGLVCLRTSTVFGLGGLLFVYGIQPLLDKALGSLRTNVLRWAAAVILALMTGDLLLVIAGYLL